MKFIETPLKDSFIVETEPIKDERGFFARSWCAKEFSEHGLDSRLEQCNISFNSQKGTLRGLHYQAPPREEAKLVRCTQGEIFDVIVDIRPQSATFKKWFGLNLSAENRKMLYVPPGFAHGFQSLMDHSEVFYQMSVEYVPNLARGIRWNDASLGISWPLASPLISPRDLSLPELSK